jgi:hypothetical protein
MSKQYCCPKCNISFKYPSLLKTHFRKAYHCLLIEEEIEKFFISYDCLLCKKKFKNIKALNRHCKETVCGKSQTLKINANDTSDISNNNLLDSLTSKELKQISNIINKKLLTNIPSLPTSIINIENEIIVNNDINESTNNDDNNITNFNYIYLIEKFNVNSKEYFYKFGKTNRECSKRLKEHGDEAKVLLIIDVDNCNVVEKKILNILRNTVNIKQCDFGNEYFLCNDKQFIKNIILKNIFYF